MTSGEHTKGAVEFKLERACSGWPATISSPTADFTLHGSGSIKKQNEVGQYIVTAVNTYPAVAELVKALEATQFGFNHRRCPVCAGWNVGPNGETDMVHTQDCIVGTALTRFREAHAGGGA